MEDKKILEGTELEEEKVENTEPEMETENVETEMEPTAPISPDDTSAQESVETEINEGLEKTEPEIVEENGAIDTSIKTFTQGDVDKLVGETRIKTREKTFNYIYGRYGVKNEEELDALVANAQRFDTQKELYDADKAAWETEKSETANKLTDMSEQIALMQSGIDSARYEDAKLILKGKGLEVNLENINNELATHPEWKKEEVKEEPEISPLGGSDTGIVKEEEEKPAPAPTVTTRITTLGNEPKPAPQLSEEEQAEKLFKLKFH